jgi:fructoselysine-6-P-deglycase FrlB-like protein
MADLHPELFAADVLDGARVLAQPPAVTEPAAALVRRARRVLFLGMGSSRYAALDAATTLRSHGFDAYAELASTGSPQPPAADTLAIAISASGGSAETLTAMRRHLGTSMVVGVTSRPQSAIGREADACLVTAADGRSGVACASYRSTVALLQALGGLVTGATGSAGAAAAASAAVLAGRDAWVDRAVELLGGGPIHVLAPAERFGSAEQSALMLREVPRVAAYACETGDWSHVDVYLTKRAGYGILLLPGSAYEPELMRWAAERGFPVVVAGGSLPGSALDIDLSGTADPAVRALVETHVAELLAAALWERDPIT